MTIRAKIVGVSGLLAVALGCSESVGPQNRTPGGLRFDVTPGSVNGNLNQSGTLLIKGFDGGNPRQGDAIIATFVWLGSSDIIDSVTDVKTTNPYTPLGNKFNRVEYVTAGGISMATYVATNVQAVTDGYVHAVEANLSQPVTDGGVVLSAWSGVYPTFGTALGAHQSASGSGSTPTVADPGSIPVAAGALAYGVSMSNGALAINRPAGFTSIGTGSDAAMVVDAEYALPASAGSVDPQWTWVFNSPRTWLATVFALNEAPTKLVFTVQPGTSLPCPATMPPVEVTAKDDKGNTVTAFNGPVTISIGRQAGALMPGKLSGTVTVAAVNGVARFTDLCIDQISTPGDGYTLRATAPEVNLSVESARFSIGVL
jgi:hypothetical protein